MCWPFRCSARPQSARRRRRRQASAKCSNVRRKRRSRTSRCASAQRRRRIRDPGSENRPLLRSTITQSFGGSTIAPKARRLTAGIQHRASMSLSAAFESSDNKRRHVRRLFATIADRYDLITAVLSYGQDRRWKARLIREAGETAGDRVLDLACGTGDIAFAVANAGANEVTGLDLTVRMLELADAKQARSKKVRWIAGDM